MDLTETTTDTPNTATVKVLELLLRLYKVAMRMHYGLLAALGNQSSPATERVLWDAKNQLLTTTPGTLWTKRAMGEEYPMLQNF